MLERMGERARSAARILAGVPTERINSVLLDVAAKLWEGREAILGANREDLTASRHNELQPALLDRLTLSEARLEGIISELKKVAALPDPVGQVFEKTSLPNGLRARKVRIPLGVLGVIYESRPNVTVDVSGLSLKTHNAAILRGGSETLATNRVLIAVIHAALSANDLPEDAIQFIDDTDRAMVQEMLQLDQYIDLIIPRGSNHLQTFCRDNSRIPVIYGGIGICHLFVDETANLTASLPLIRNAKIQAPSVCNALDVVLAHRSIANKLIPEIVELLAADEVEFRLDERALKTLPVPHPPSVKAAESEDFDTEWLSLVLSVKVVDSLEEAIRHIAEHSTHHSDGILTEDKTHADRFCAEVDSAAVYVNASTRFTDGAQFGLGAEVAISTGRLHARGPMGLKELTSYKWVLEGDYTLRP